MSLLFVIWSVAKPSFRSGENSCIGMITHGDHFQNQSFIPVYCFLCHGKLLGSVDYKFRRSIKCPWHRIIILFLSLISLPVCREPPLGLYQSNNIALDNLGLWELHWRHNDHDGVSNHQPHGFLLNRLFRRRSKNTKALRHWPLCGEFTGSGEFPAQRASYAENVSIWWRHHGDDLPREINVDLWYSIFLISWNPDDIIQDECHTHVVVKICLLCSN